MGMSLTSKVGYKLGCGPFAPEVFDCRFQICRYGDGLSKSGSRTANSTDKDVLATRLRPK